jgi:hypothetical protein
MDGVMGSALLQRLGYQGPEIQTRLLREASPAEIADPDVVAYLLNRPEQLHRTLTACASIPAELLVGAALEAPVPDGGGWARGQSDPSDWAMRALLKRAREGDIPGPLLTKLRARVRDYGKEQVDLGASARPQAERGIKVIVNPSAHGAARRREYENSRWHRATKAFQVVLRQPGGLDGPTLWYGLAYCGYGPRDYGAVLGQRELTWDAWLDLERLAVTWARPPAPRKRPPPVLATLTREEGLERFLALDAAEGALVLRVWARLEGMLLDGAQAAVVASLLEHPMVEVRTGTLTRLSRMEAASG